MTDPTQVSGSSTADTEPRSMPPGGQSRSGSGKSWMRTRVSLSATITASDTQAQEDKRNAKKHPMSTSEVAEQGNPESVGEEIHAHEVELELHRQLFDSLRDCSRQRLRALRMTMRRYGSPEARISTKELLQVFQENNLKIPSRTFQLLVDSYEDTMGVDYEKMWNSFVAAQSKTGRDSVMAQNKRNDLEVQTVERLEDKDRDLERRLVAQLSQSTKQYDLQKLRTNFQNRDKNKTGKIKRDDTESYITESQLPIYGALLKSLLNRCELEKDNHISWPEIMSFLEKAHLAVSGGATGTPASTQLQRPPTAQSTVSQTSLIETNPKQSFAHKSGRRIKSSTPRNKRQGAAPVPKGKRAASAVPTSSTPTKGEDGKQTEDRKSTSEPGQPEVTSAAIVTQGNQQKETDNQGNIPQPIAKDMVKAAFKKVVGEGNEVKQDTKGDGDPNEPPENKTKKQSLALAKKTLFSKKSAANPTQGSKEELKKATASVKTASGFLNSMKSLIKGGKKNNQPDPKIPSIKVEKQETTILEEKEISPQKENKTKGTPSKAQPQPASANSLIPPSPRQKKVEVEIDGRSEVYHPPDGYDEGCVNTDPPQERLKLEWIYGYRGNDCRSNIYILKGGEITYFIGNVTVIYNRDQHHQRHYREHTSDIKCMAVHHDGIFVATGQATSDAANNDAHVRVWRSDTLQTLHVLGMGSLEKSVNSLSFSRNSKGRICAVDCSDGHIIYVWGVDSGKLLAQSKMELDAVCDIDFTPHDQGTVAVVGKEHIGWWKIYPESESVQLHQMADHQKYLRAKYVICLLHNEKGDLITGDSNGTVYVWGSGGNIITNLIKHGHDGPVFTLLFTRGTLITGGRDGMIYGWMWGKNMDQSGKIEIPKPEGGVRMLQNHKDRLLIGTTTNSILLATLSGQALRNPLAGVALDKTALTMGHFDDVRGLCTSKDPELSSLVFTAGEDGIICLFDTFKKQPLWKFFLRGTRISCIDANTTDGFIGVGTRDSVVVFSIEKDEENQVFLSEVFRRKVAKEKITTIKLAPDCESLAAADIAGCVYVVGLKDGDDGGGDDEEEVWDLLREWQAGDGAITALDWSSDMFADTYIIRASSSSKQLSYWNTETGDKITKTADVKNIVWYTEHCLLGYDKTGMWFSKQAKEGQIQTVDVNVGNTLLAVGDSNGYISLFRYPCSKQGMYSHTYSLHRQVPKIVFTKSATNVLSVGAKDSTVAQWLIQ